MNPKIKKSTLRHGDHLGVLTYTAKPVRMPDGSWIHPDHPEIKADLSHIAIGLWCGYLAVIFIPGRKGSPDLSEKHLMQAYGGAMNVFALLTALIVVAFRVTSLPLQV